MYHSLYQAINLGKNYTFLIFSYFGAVENKNLLPTELVHLVDINEFPDPSVVDFAMVVSPSLLKGQEPSEVTKRVVNSLKESGLKGIDLHTAAGIAVNKMFGRSVFGVHNSSTLEEDQVNATAILIFLKNMGIQTQIKNEKPEVKANKSKVEVSESYQNLKENLKNISNIVKISINRKGSPESGEKYSQRGALNFESLRKNLVFN